MFRLLDLIFPGTARLKKELSAANQAISSFTDNLVGWEGEELELMSFIQEERKFRSSWHSSVSGVICSIYHEHMIAYIWKKLFGLGSDLEIIVANTKKYRFEYVTKSGATSFYVNDQFLGELKKDNGLYISKNKVLASIEQKSTFEWWKIYFDGQYIGSLNNPELAREVNPRAFDLRRNISQDAEMVFLAMATFKIIDITRRIKKLPFR